MSLAYIKLSVAILLPVIASAAMYLLDQKSRFARSGEWAKHIIIGVIFGGLAVLGTEWGIPIDGTQVSCRDAAVLTAGLIYSGPSGIIAGLIGGIECWFTSADGVGEFTRTAGTISTILAGFYAAALRKYLFDKKRPSWLLSLAIGLVMEVIYLVMIVITNMASASRAMEVVQTCSVPTIIANAISVMLATMAVSLLGKESLLPQRDAARISQIIQRWLLLAVAVAFAASSVFIFIFEDTVVQGQADQILNQALDEIEADVRDSSDVNLLTITRKISRELGEASLEELARKYNVAEINVVNGQGVIVESTEPLFVEFRFSSGEQSAEFLSLLDVKTEYVQSYGPITYDPSISRKYAGVQLEEGFLQVGYNADQFQKDIALQISDITKNRHVGEEGFVFILDQRLNIVSAPKEILKEIALADKKMVPNVTDGERFTMEIQGITYACYCRTAESYYMVSAMPESEVYESRNTAIYVNTFVEIIIFAALFVLIFQLIKRVVVNQIKAVNHSLAKIAGGDLDEVINVRSNEEFTALSDDINSTVSTLKRYIDEASARIDKELEFAKNIQASALPNVFPAFPQRKEFDIYASMNPAKEVGGDFYDFYLTGNKTLNFLIADVSGKGIPAAMFMMRAKTELKSLTETGTSLCNVFTRSNAALCEGNDAGMFVTAWQGSINLNDGAVQFVNAGHNPPLVRHKGGEFEFLRSRAGFVLAGMEETQYKEQELQLLPGDIIYLYTDGVTEATNASNELYGEKRLLAIVNSREFTDMKDLCRTVKADVDAFVGEAPQFDDITMVAVKYTGKPSVPTIHFDAAQINDIPAVMEFVEAELEKLNCPMKSVMQIDVAIDEIYSNIVNHGYKEKPGPITVKVVERAKPHAVCVRFSDEAKPYNPLTEEDPDITLSIEERKVGGLGIYMVKKTMDEVRYKYEGGQNVLTVIKNL